MQSKTENNLELHARVFPHHSLVTCNCFVLWLARCTVSLYLLWLVEIIALVWFWFNDTQLKTPSAFPCNVESCWCHLCKMSLSLRNNRSHLTIVLVYSDNERLTSKRSQNKEFARSRRRVAWLMYVHVLTTLCYLSTQTHWQMVSICFTHAMESRLSEPSIFRNSLFLEPKVGSLGFALVGYYNVSWLHSCVYTLITNSSRPITENARFQPFIV